MVWLLGCFFCVFVGFKVPTSRWQVHDVGEFVDEHPGGPALLRTSVGTDATVNFHGRVYKHSRAARNLMAHYRVARVPSSKKD